MESNSKQLSIANTQSSNPQEDPNLTLSDDDDDFPLSTRPPNAIKPAKHNGRWTKQEQLLFLEHIVTSRGNSLSNLHKHLPKRSNAQIKIHSHQFIQMCKNEVSVSKTKQQNKSILHRICKSYGFHPTDSYLSLLESIILEPPIDLTLSRNINHLIGKKPYERAPSSSGVPKTKRKRSKQIIFSITKTQRKAKVINIVTINVLTTNHSLLNDGLNMNHNKAKLLNPFNINFNNEIMNTTNKDNSIDLNLGVNKDIYCKEETVNDIIQSLNGSDMISSMIDYESFNY